jgi:hypothetical protein
MYRRSQRNRTARRHAWFSGFVTAYVGLEAASKFDLQFTGGWLTSYCMANPDKAVVAAAATFIEQMTPTKAARP